MTADNLPAVIQTGPPPAMPYPVNSLMSSAMSLKEALDQRDLIKSMVQKVLKSGLHFGVIPGTEKKAAEGQEAGKGKDVLLKPGAELLCSIFRLAAEFRCISKVEDFATGLAFYQYECVLTHIPSGTRMGGAIGQGSTFESKYRWRTGGRVCPKCGKDAINYSKRAKEEPEKAWYCWNKKGGCGAQFHENDELITSQKPGRVQNPDLIDQWNTVDKMSQKRSLIAAVLIVLAVSDYFTQDLDDEIDPEVPKQTAKTQERNVTQPMQNGKPAAQSTQTTKTPPAKQPDAVLEKTRAEAIHLVEKLAVLCDEGADEICKKLSGDAVPRVEILRTMSFAGMMQKIIQNAHAALSKIENADKEPPPLDQVDQPAQAQQ